MSFARKLNSLLQTYFQKPFLPPPGSPGVSSAAHKITNVIHRTWEQHRCFSRLFPPLEQKWLEKWPLLLSLLSLWPPARTVCKPADPFAGMGRPRMQPRHSPANGSRASNSPATAEPCNREYKSRMIPQSARTPVNETVRAWCVSDG